MQFSDRIGITKPKSIIQIDSIDDDLRNSLWNFFADEMGDVNNYTRNWFNLLAEFFRYFYKKPVVEVPQGNTDSRKYLYDWFMSAKWYEIYNFTEFVISSYFRLKYRVDMPKFEFRSQEKQYFSTLKTNKEKFVEYLNHLLERELSGFRVIDEHFVPISDTTEIDSINEALEETKSHKLSGIKRHIEKAVELLSRKPAPDYANSIKESISAVEGICKIVIGKKSGGLSDVIKYLSDKGIYMHPALKDAFIKLYGYTSDEDGIRHPILEDGSQINLAEAKFMLVTCSAFVNFIILKLDKLVLK